MKMAQDEGRQIFRRKRTIDETRLSEMKYLKSVVKNTMRLLPALPFLLPRESQEKCEINGCEIHAKTRVIVNALEIGRDPRYWTVIISNLYRR